MTFIGECPKGMEGCHNDGNATNNKLDNLRWDTHANNILDKIKHETIAKGSSHGNSKLTEEQVKEIKWMLNNNISQDRLARLLNISRRTISMIAKGKIWNHVKTNI